MTHRDISTHRATRTTGLAGELPKCCCTAAEPYSLRDYWKAPELVMMFGRRQVSLVLRKALYRLAELEGWKKGRAS